MRALSLSALLIASVAAAGPGLAKGQANAAQQQGVGELKKALAAVAASAKPPDHFNPKVDRDQGDDNANPRAILRVCSKDTPAAHRSAICPTGVSP